MDPYIMTIPIAYSPMPYKAPKPDFGVAFLFLAHENQDFGFRVLGQPRATCHGVQVPKASRSYAAPIPWSPDPLRKGGGGSQDQGITRCPSNSADFIELLK